MLRIYLECPIHCIGTVGCQKFVQYIRMLWPGQFILIAAVAHKLNSITGPLRHKNQSKHLLVVRKMQYSYLKSINFIGLLFQYFFQFCDFFCISHFFWIVIEFSCTTVGLDKATTSLQISAASPLSHRAFCTPCYSCSLWNKTSYTFFVQYNIYINKTLSKSDIFKSILWFW